MVDFSATCRTQKRHGKVREGRNGVPGGGKYIGGLVLTGGALLVGMLCSITIATNINRRKPKDSEERRYHNAENSKARRATVDLRENGGLLWLLPSDLTSSRERTHHAGRVHAIIINRDEDLNVQCSTSSIHTDEDLKAKETMEELPKEESYETCPNESDRETENKFLPLTHFDASLPCSLVLENLVSEIAEDDRDDRASIMLQKDNSAFSCSDRGFEIDHGNDNGPVIEFEDSEPSAMLDSHSKIICDHSKQEEIISLRYSELGMSCSSAESSNGVFWPQSLSDRWCKQIISCGDYDNRVAEDAVSDGYIPDYCVEEVRDGDVGNTPEVVGEGKGGHLSGIPWATIQCLDPNLLALSLGSFLLVIIIQMLIYFIL